MSYDAPKSKEDLFEYAKIQLGEGAHKVNVTDRQMETRLRQAFDKFNTHHYNATEHLFVAQQITEQDRNRGYFITPEYIKTVIRMLAFDGRRRGEADQLWVPGGMVPAMGWNAWGDGGVAGGMGNMDVGVGPGGITNAITYYLMDMQQAHYDEIMFHEDSIRYNELTHRLYPDVSKSKLVVGQYIVYEAFGYLEKMGEPAVYNDDWLKRYFTALVGLQWGTNLTKHIDAPLYGGDAKINGQGILDRYTEDKLALEEELESTYSAQPMMWIG